MDLGEGHGRAAWAHTSSLLAMLVNVHRTKGRRARPSDFGPYASRRGGGLRVGAANIHVLEALLPAHKRTRSMGKTPASERNAR